MKLHDWKLLQSWETPAPLRQESWRIKRLLRLKLHCLKNTIKKLDHFQLVYSK